MQCRIDAEFKEVVSLFSNVKSRLLFPFQNESVRLDHHVKKCGYRKIVFSKRVCNVVVESSTDQISRSTLDSNNI